MPTTRPASGPASGPGSASTSGGAAVGSRTVIRVKVTPLSNLTALRAIVSPHGRRLCRTDVDRRRVGDLRQDDCVQRLEYGLFDADNHYYEPRDCFTRHIAPQ